MDIRKGYFPVFQFIFVAICSFVLSAGTCLKISCTTHQRFKKVCGRKTTKGENSIHQHFIPENWEEVAIFKNTYIGFKLVLLVQCFHLAKEHCFLSYFFFLLFMKQ